MNGITIADIAAIVSAAGGIIMAVATFLGVLPKLGVHDAKIDQLSSDMAKVGAKVEAVGGKVEAVAPAVQAAISAAPVAPVAPADASTGAEGCGRLFVPGTYDRETADIEVLQ